MLAVLEGASKILSFPRKIFSLRISTPTGLLRENGTKWALDLQFPDSVSFNVLKIQEPIHMGQRISKFHVKILGGEGQWRRVINGTTVGYQRLIPFQRLKTRRVRFVVDKSQDDPLISYLGL
ncbi:hypothetical protein SAY87_028659 [Trapa incisa]|uniref:F5/8 type C domain-containing protein n=1 Tax=Trapa incisa TaxID=236973 RepID=A0AAN7KVA6_9MYRT|nr:hypothetical protein SAY87_028659 [Trapa incisa]